MTEILEAIDWAMARFRQDTPKGPGPIIRQLWLTNGAHWDGPGLQLTATEDGSTYVLRKFETGREGVAEEIFFPASALLFVSLKYP